MIFHQGLVVATKVGAWPKSEIKEWIESSIADSQTASQFGRARAGQAARTLCVQALASPSRKMLSFPRKREPSARAQPTSKNQWPSACATIAVNDCAHVNDQGCEISDWNGTWVADDGGNANEEVILPGVYAVAQGSPAVVLQIHGQASLQLDQWSDTATIPTPDSRGCAFCDRAPRSLWPVARRNSRFARPHLSTI
jgi:hypothetical protein